MATNPLALVSNAETGGGAMSDTELVSYLQENADRAVGHYETEISGDQARVIDYYYGRMLDVPAVEGGSSVTDSTVSIVVDNFVANVIKPFVSSDETVLFQPRSEEDVEQAEQATEYVNYVVHCDNPGFMILHDWAKDAGMAKLGVVKIWWEDQSDKRPQLIEGLDAGQVEQMAADIVQGPFSDDGETFAAYVMSDYDDGRIKIENVPPEEYLLSPYTRPGQVAPYEAHRTRKARSELIEMGFDAEIVEDLPKYAYAHDDERTIARYRDEQYDSTQTDAPGDKSRDMIEIYHEFVLIDFDGDGVSERRQVIRSGPTILYNEEYDHQIGPFARYCPVPMPHKVYGTCPGEQVIVDQRIKTVLQRQQLDNLYKSNNPRPHIPEGAERADGSTMQDLADGAPGAAVREGRMPIRYEAVPFVADKAYTMQEYADREIERKTGVAKEGQSLDRDALNNTKTMTATQANIQEEGSNTRIEMMSRIFAETGISDMFKIILKLLVKHQPRARMIRLRNKWVSMDPREWNSEMDLSISVGLGVGNKADQIAQSQFVLTTMAEVAQSPFSSLVNEEKAYNALKRAYTAAGIKNTDDFIVEPERDEGGNLVPKETPPDPEMVKVQAEMQAQQAKLEMEGQKAEADVQLAREKAAADIETTREQGSAKLQLMREEAALKAQLEREKAAFEAEQAIRQQEFEMQMAERQMQMNEKMAERKAATQEREADSRMKKYREGGSLAE